MLPSRHISIPAKYYTCTRMRVYLNFNKRNHEWLVFFLTILLTDGPEGAEENVTHQQYGLHLHDTPSSLNCSIPLKYQTPSALLKGWDQLISQTCGLQEWTYSLRGATPNRKRKPPFRNRTVVVALEIWIRFFQNLSKISTLGETPQLPQPFLWRSVRHSSPTRQVWLYAWA